MNYKGNEKCKIPTRKMLSIPTTIITIVKCMRTQTMELQQDRPWFGWRYKQVGYAMTIEACHNNCHFMVFYIHTKYAESYTKYIKNVYKIVPRDGPASHRQLSCIILYIVSIFLYLLYVYNLWVLLINPRVIRHINK